MAEKPRQVVNGLGALPQLVPAADPRLQDSYARPAAPDVAGPEKINPFMQLSDALAQLDPSLKRAVSYQATIYGEEEVAKGEKEFWDNREKWNGLIRDGQLPEGASPYFQRGLQRAALKQHAGDFYSQVHADFYGEAGAEARNSNDPAVMQKFIADSRNKYVGERLKNQDRDLFSALDLQEVFNPAADQASRSMLQTHAAYRVNEREKEYEALATSQIEGVLDQYVGNIKPTDNENVRMSTIRSAAFEANRVLYDPDTGIVKNGLSAAKGNELLVDSIATKMMKTGNRMYGEVLDHVKTGQGASIGKTKYAMEKIRLAEEHITDKAMKEQHFQNWQESLPFEKRSREHTQASWDKEDQRWEREKASWQRQDGEFAKDEIINTFARRIFEGLRRDPKEGTRIIDEAIREAATVSWKDAEHLKNMVHTATKQRADYDDDPMTVAQMRLDISKNPLGFSYDKLTAAVKDKLLKPSTMLQMVDDLERNKANGDHPYLKQPEFTRMLHTVEKSMAQSMGEDEYGEGALRASEAVGDFRDLGVEWIEKNPQGSISSFRNYMRSQIQDVAERHNAPYGAEQKKQRKDQTQKGEKIVKGTSEEVKQKEDTEARRKKQYEDTIKSHREQMDKQLDRKPESKIKPDQLRTLLTGEQKKEIVALRDRVLKPGVSEKPATQEQLKDHILKTLKPLYQNATPQELADGVNEFMRVLIPPPAKPKKDK